MGRIEEAAYVDAALFVAVAVAVAVAVHVHVPVR